MNFNVGNIKTIDKKRLVLNNFSGVDYSTSMMNVAPNRATEMRNFLKVNGINRTRKGWKEFCNVNASINGFWQLQLKSKAIHTIFQAGKKFYRITTLGNESHKTVITEITLNANVDSNKIVNKKSFAVVNGERLYIFCGDYLVYGSWDSGTTWEIRRVEDNSDTYIPTTTIGISRVGSVINSRVGFEKVNLLSSKRKNKLIGEEAYRIIEGPKINNNPNTIGKTSFIKIISDYQISSVNYLTLTISNASLSYNVRATFTPTSSWTTKVYDKAESINDFGSTWEEGFSGIDLPIMFVRLELNYMYANGKLHARVTYYYETSMENTEVYFGAITINKYFLDTTNIDNDFVPVVYNYDSVISSSSYSVNYTEGSITFNNALLPVVEGESNITVLFKKRINGYADRINKCTFGTLYGYNARKDNLFISGNEDYPNVDFYTSEVYSVKPTFDLTYKSYSDFTYFPDVNYSVIGSEISPIIDYKLLTDGTLMIMKKSIANEPTVYFRGNTLVDAYDKDGKAILSVGGDYQYQDVVYPIKNSTIGEGSISRFGNANLNGDVLMLSKRGVYGIELQSNISQEERYAFERSIFINPKLRELDLTNASAISYDGKYFLAVNDEEGLCYVADSRYKTLTTGNDSGAFNYEWWVLNNIKANIWFVLNDALCFGTNDGKLCMFTENSFIDEYTSLISDGSLTYDNLGTKLFTINSSYDSVLQGLKEKDSINIVHDTKTIVRDILTLTNIISIDYAKVEVDQEIFLNEIRYLENKNVFLDSPDATEELTIKNLNYEEQTFELYLESTPYNLNDLEFRLCANVELEDLFITNIDYEDGTFKVMNNIGTIIEPYFFLESGVAVIDVKGFFKKRDIVKSYWQTPIFDMGTSDYSKNLHSVSLTPENVVNGEIVFGLKTKQLDEDFIVKGTKLFDFNDTDFEDFSFETSSFAKSDTRKVNIKKFNFITFYFKSDKPKDCSVNNFSVTYSIARLNKGVR